MFLALHTLINKLGTRMTILKDERQKPYANYVYDNCVRTATACLALRSTARLSWFLKLRPRYKNRVLRIGYQIFAKVFNRVDFGHKCSHPDVFATPSFHVFLSIREIPQKFRVS